MSAISSLYLKQIVIYAILLSTITASGHHSSNTGSISPLPSEIQILSPMSYYGLEYGDAHTVDAWILFDNILSFIHFFVALYAGAA
jgi:hypothetical protein